MSKEQIVNRVATSDYFLQDAQTLEDPEKTAVRANEAATAPVVHDTTDTEFINTVEPDVLPEPTVVMATIPVDEDIVGQLGVEELPDQVSPVQADAEDPEDSIGNIDPNVFDPNALCGLLDQRSNQEFYKFREQVIRAFDHFGLATGKFFPE
jgi:hypothetical protein